MIDINVKMSREDSGLESECMLLMIKPWCLHLTEAILAEFDAVAKRLAVARLDNVPISQIAEHYRAHSAQPYFAPMINDLTGKTIVLAVYEGKPQELLRTKHSVRQKYAASVPPHALYHREVIHASVNNKEFAHESNVWKDYLYALVVHHD